jgi:hypothetical protein
MIMVRERHSKRERQRVREEREDSIVYDELLSNEFRLGLPFGRRRR